MQSSISLKVLFGNHLEKRELDFFRDIEWTPESEKKFISKIHELFSIVRNHTANIELSLNISTNDISNLAFILNKNKSTKLEFNCFKLSLREIEILELIMEGMTNNKIAEKLFISYETVKTHRKNILGKTGSNNTAFLVYNCNHILFRKLNL